ncbi:aldo/keto reductase [Actinocorallia populi]|uniref:aldo/keto reductase n=1 Tax=Actinocorallia populi TaxID=2079200 RepID=UPI000D089A3A|nr:aldo/keto reductase [Actinocorallia populi]
MNIQTNTAGSFPLGGDLKINRLGFGAMRLPASFGFSGDVRDPEEGVAVLRRAVELGADHIDSAGFYAREGVRAHDLIRRALHPYDGLAVATKVGPLLGDDGVPSRQAPPERLRELVEADMEALGVDRLDLVYLRVGGLGVPGGEPVGERFAVLAGLREEGLIRHLGLSHVDPAQLAEAREVAPVAAVQNSFNLMNTRPGDAELIAECERSGIAFVPFFPLGGGFQPLAAAGLDRVAARHGATRNQVALAWLLARSPVMLPIPGTGSLAHLEENMAAADLRLTREDLAGLAA